MIVRLNVRHCDWTCSARTILRSIVRMLVQFIGGIYISTVSDSFQLTKNAAQKDNQRKSLVPLVCIHGIHTSGTDNQRKSLVPLVCIHGIHTSGTAWQIEADKSCYDRKSLHDYMQHVRTNGRALHCDNFDRIWSHLNNVHVNYSDAT